MNTCRFCHEYIRDDRDAVKYGTRHYAHWGCFFAAGKSLASLSRWQQGRVPLWAVRNLPGVQEQLDALGRDV